MRATDAETGRVIWGAQFVAISDLFSIQTVCESGGVGSEASI